MKQFGKILKFELKHYFKNKIFVGVTIFLVILIAVVMCFPRILDLVKKEETAASDVSAVMYLMSEDPTLDTVQLDLYRDAFSAAFTNYNIQLYNSGIDELKNEIIISPATVAFVLKSATEYTYYVNTLSLYDINTQIADETLQQLYRVNRLCE